MKTFIVVLVSLVVGVAVGLGATWAEFSKEPILGPDALKAEAPLSVAPVEATSIRSISDPVAFYEPVYGFGFMEVGSEGQHDFTIANQGDVPLELTFIKTSCHCIVGKLKLAKGDKIIVPPKDQTVFTLTWTPKGTLGEFRQNALLESNDPQHRQIKLTVEGQVTQSIVVKPKDLVFSSMTPTLSVSGELRVYGCRDKPVEILGHHLEEAGTADLFQVSYQRLEGTEFPDVPGANCAWEVKVQVKPGLPLGPFSQKIVLETNVEAAKSLVVPVFGDVTSDLKVMGKDWNPKSGILTIGTIPSREGAKRTLYLLVRQEGLVVEVEKVEPKFMVVSAGAPVQANNGAVTRVPIEISIPAGSETVSHLGGPAGRLGEILLKTNHPDAEHVRVRVEFAVQR